MVLQTFHQSLFDCIFSVATIITKLSAFFVLAGAFKPFTCSVSLSLSLCVCVCVCVFMSIHSEGFIYLGLEFQGTDQQCCLEDVPFLGQVPSLLL